MHLVRVEPLLVDSTISLFLHLWDSSFPHSQRPPYAGQKPKLQAPQFQFTVTIRLYSLPFDLIIWKSHHIFY